MALSRPARLSALFLVCVALAALMGQLVVSLGLTGSLGAAIWAVVRFFTILTNLLVLASYGAMAARGRALAPGWLAGLTLWIAAVGLVYHILLAGLVDFAGLAWWVDQGLHSAVPVLAVLWWLAFAPKARLGWRHPLVWLAWPLAYVVYALVRGAIDRVYPYPFVDVTALGYGGVAQNAAGLTLVFFVAGLGLVALARGLTR